MLDSEAKFLKRLVLVGNLDCATADEIRRPVPTARALFDDFMYRLSAHPIGDGTWDMVSGLLPRYGKLISTSATARPPGVPEPIIERVIGSSRRFPSQASQDSTLHGHGDTDDEQAKILTDLVVTLGDANHLPDAGFNIYVATSASRIRDGHVDPWVGARTWGTILGLCEPERSDGALKATREVRAIASAWESNPGVRRSSDAATIRRLASENSWSVGH